MERLTLSLTGKSSELSAEYNPPIELNRDADYIIGLIDLVTYNSIPNINDKNNKFHVTKMFNHKEDGLIEKENICVVLAPGSYELEEIIAKLNTYLAEADCPIMIEDDKKTMKSFLNVECGETFGNTKCLKLEIDFTREHSIGSVLGFSPRKIVLDYPRRIESDHLINIQNVNIIRVECNLVFGSYINDRSTHTIYEFYPTVAPGYKIVEVPKNIIYLPVVVRTIRHLDIRIVDQNSELIDFRGEQISCRVYIQKI